MNVRAFVVGTILLAACAPEGADELTGGRPPPAESSETPPPPAEPAPPPPASQCPAEVGKSYVGFGQRKLEASRASALSYEDRARIKPYSALGAELARVLGTTPATLASSANAFDDPPPRWFSETKSSAGTVYAFYAVAFDGCLAFTSTGTAYAAAPTVATATSECTTMAQKFWSRAPTAEETQACVDVAMGSSSEPSARRRWAYTCAAVLSAAGFVAY
jgi:hypothetical protein